MADFDRAFSALVENEGGYSNNPADPGGETMWGITQRVARSHGYAGSMRELPLSIARAIAKAEYWDPVKGDQLPEPLGFQVFDGAYNSGVAQASKWLQQAAGVTADGVIGPATLAAVAAAPALSLVAKYNAARLLFLAKLPTWPSFGKGWANRIANNLQRAAS